MASSRKLFLINPRFQLVFMGYTALIAVFAIGIFYAANLYFFSDFVKTGQAIGLPPDHVFFQFISNQKLVMNQIFAVTAGLVAVVLAVGGLFFSHRIAGPLYRLNQHMREVALGRTTQGVHFRDGDFFLEVAESYNSQLKTLLERDSRQTLAPTPPPRDHVA
jgi:hypothetical protein